MAANNSIQNLRVETYNRLTQLQEWGLAILKYELEQAQVRIIQAGGTIPDVNGSGGVSVIEKRILLADIVGWVPKIESHVDMAINNEVIK